MATFDVETAEMWRAAAQTEQFSGALRELASVLAAQAELAPAAGDPTSAAALRDFIAQWSSELATEAKELATMAHDLRAAAVLYESTEGLAATSFTPSGTADGG